MCAVFQKRCLQHAAVSSPYSIALNCGRVHLTGGVLQLSTPDFLEIFRTARYSMKRYPRPITCRNSFLLPQKQRSIWTKNIFSNLKPIIIPWRTLKIASKTEVLRILQYSQPFARYWQCFPGPRIHSISIHGFPKTHGYPNGYFFSILRQFLR